MKIPISYNYKIATIKAIFGIILFILTYLLLVAMAISLAIGCVIGAYEVYNFKPGLGAIFLAIGLLALGFLVAFPLLGFLFKKYHTDRSNYIEVTEAQEPKLFQFIREVATEVQTDFPKHVYLSSEVNASVFFDSSFWSMFLPVRKNLHIGLGLINTSTEQDFKSVLAHEMGHFSQRTMKLGSYIYYVNQVIYNFFNGYDSLNWKDKWSEIHFILGISVWVAQKIINGAQWILFKIYHFMYLNYLELSREMEYHADTISVHVAGYQSFKNLHLRTPLVIMAWDSLLEYYSTKIIDNVTSENIFKDQLFVLKMMGQTNNVTFFNQIPFVTENDLNRLYKSKLVIRDRWATHPSITDRINAQKHATTNTTDDYTSAFQLFVDPEKTQKQMTDMLFSTIHYSDKPIVLSQDEFEKDCSTFIQKFWSPDKYNGYYTPKNPTYFDLDKVASTEINTTITMEDLFGPEAIEMVYLHTDLEEDLNAIEAIANQQNDITVFEYDGQKYPASKAQQLIPEITQQIEKLKTKIEEHDQTIYHYFHQLARQHGLENTLKEKYETLFQLHDQIEEHAVFHDGFYEQTQIIGVSATHEQIKENYNAIIPMDLHLKELIKQVLDEERTKEILEPGSLANFQQFITQEIEYFHTEGYYLDRAQLLFAVANDYMLYLNLKYLNYKSELLIFQVQLLHPATTTDLQNSNTEQVLLQ